MDSIGMSCIKYLLFLFNLIFAVSGIAVLAIGIMIQQMYYTYSIFFGETFFSVAGIFIVVGVFIFVIAFFGCCGAIKESNYMLITFAILLCLIFISEIVGGVAAYVMKDEILPMIETQMNNSLKSYKDISHAKTWNIIQHDMACCGVRSSSDWTSVFPNNSLPHTCCPNLATDENCTPEYASQKGCLSRLESALELKDTTFMIINFGIAVAAVQFIGVIFACCLSRSIRQYETV